MDCYLEIQLRPDPEFSAQHLLSGLYARLHRALVQLDSKDIGVSFPDYRDAKAVAPSPAQTAAARRDGTGSPSLGSRLRVHGPQSSLQQLNSTTWLRGMLDHVVVSAVTPVPPGASHRHYTRVQAKSNPARLRRRAMRRHDLDADAAALRIPEDAAERLQLPFVVIGSRSTGQASFPLFIRQGPIQPEAVSGTFNSYGLSQHATVPWF